MLARGDGLYYDLNRYPFTVSPYGPIFFGATAALHLLGPPLYQMSRLISFGAFLTAVWLVWHTAAWLGVRSYSRAYACYRARGRPCSLVLAGSCCVLAFFIKQASVAATAAIAARLFLEDRKRALRWLAGLADAGAATVLALNSLGGSLSSGCGLGQSQPVQRVETGTAGPLFRTDRGGVILVALAGMPRAVRRFQPLSLGDRRW